MRIVKLNDNPQHHENYHLVYRRPLQPKGDSVWEFCGYRCLNCDRVIKLDNTLIKHSVSCKPYTRKYTVEPEDITIYNVKGELWTPFEMNQVSPEVDNIENDK